MPGLILVTACERNYFLMACLLMHSLRRWAPDLPLYVLDFGMEEAQRRFLSAHCTVLARPTELAPNLHPFTYKTAIADFLRPVEWRAMVWLDCDMLAVGPVGEQLTAIIGEMETQRREVAVCLDGVATIAGILASGYNVAPFANAVAAAGTDTGGPYYNTGLFACASPAFLRDWADLAKTAASQVNFDQNIFNLVIHRRGPALTLDAREWNLHGAMLAGASVVQDAQGGEMVMAGGKRTLILHPTSPRQEDLFVAKDVEIGNARIAGQLFLCRNPALNAVQQAVMTQFFTQSAEEFRRAGLMLPVAPGR